MRWQPHLPHWAAAVRANVGDLHEVYHGVCMFIDGTFQQFCRPGCSPSFLRGVPDIQAEEEDDDSDDASNDQFLL